MSLIFFCFSLAACQASWSSFAKFLFELYDLFNTEVGLKLKIFRSIFIWGENKFFFNWVHLKLLIFWMRVCSFWDQIIFLRWLIAFCSAIISLSLFIQVFLISLCDFSSSSFCWIIFWYLLSKFSSFVWFNFVLKLFSGDLKRKLLIGSPGESVQSIHFALVQNLDCFALGVSSILWSLKFLTFQELSFMVSRKFE